MIVFQILIWINAGAQRLQGFNNALVAFNAKKKNISKLNNYN